MIRHVLFTGEIGAGKSTALRRTLALMEADAAGIETYSPEPRGARPKNLYLRAYGSDLPGEWLCTMPDGDRKNVVPVFDGHAAQMLKAAQRTGDLIVIDEIGRIECEAHGYHAALRACLEGDKPVIGVIRKHQAAWADWIRAREDVMLLDVMPKNRDALPALAAGYLTRAMKRGT